MGLVEMKKLLLAAIAVTLGATSTNAQTSISISKDAGCGCCVVWIDHLEKHKYQTTSRNLDYTELSDYKTQRSVPDHLRSCHTAEVGGYTIEGHVPAADIDRLLAEKPDAIGLTVPGMPLGSPGMDFGGQKDAYDVLLIKANGSTEVFASYAAE